MELGLCFTDEDILFMQRPLNARYLIAQHKTFRRDPPISVKSMSLALP